tara:strand:- start:566 stop:931 length:366 start_codon:yes stop_codon:yes gene_type:complete
MKRFLLPLLAALALPTAVNAEEYICADKLSEERPTYKRVKKKKFIGTTLVDGKPVTSENSVVKETKNFIIFIESFDDQDFIDFTYTILDKRNKEFYGTYTSWESGKNPEEFTAFGSCLVVD